MGKGAFGMVYRGINVQTGEMVAVKQIELSNLKQADLKASMAELELLKELDHENIETIEVLKGSKAVEKYGDKARDGVVIITSKK